MSLRRKPHSVVAYPSEEVLSRSVLMGHADGSAVPLDGMMVPVRSDQMYEDYGVETRRGWLFMGDPEAAPAFVEGGRVVWGARLFAVVGGPLLFEGFGAADNVSVPLEEVVNVPPIASS